MVPQLFQNLSKTLQKNKSILPYIENLDWKTALMLLGYDKKHITY